MVHAREGEAPLLATRVYRKRIPGKPWGLKKEIEQLVVLRAIHGDHINQALHDFYSKAVQGSTVTFTEGEQARTVTVHAMGYAGHNRMMNGVPLPTFPRKKRAPPLPSFVLACLSQQYFGRSMRHDGVPELVMTRTYMAPEAYVIEATVRGIGSNLTRNVRREVVRAYARWQRISERAAGASFAKL